MKSMRGLMVALAALMVLAWGVALVQAPSRGAGRARMAPTPAAAVSVTDLANGAMSSAGTAVTPVRPEFLPTPAAGYGTGTAWCAYTAEFAGTFAAASTAGATLSLYAVRALDGTNYSTAPTYATKAYHSEQLVGTFVCKGALTPFTERIRLTPANQILPDSFKLDVGVPYKFYLVNDSGQVVTGAVTIVPEYTLTDRWPQ